jgi:hypothetical protein
MEQLRLNSSLQDIPARPRPNRSTHKLLILVHREHQDTHLGRLFFYLAGSFNSTDLRRADVHDDQVWSPVEGESDGLLRAVRRFYYDTITHAAVPLRFLIELVGADRVLLATDIPFDMQNLSFEDYLAQIGLDGDALVAINGANAAALFGLDT